VHPAVSKRKEQTDYLCRERRSPPLEEAIAERQRGGEKKKSGDRKRSYLSLCWKAKWGQEACNKTELLSKDRGGKLAEKNHEF